MKTWYFEPATGIDVGPEIEELIEKLNKEIGGHTPNIGLLYCLLQERVDKYDRELIEVARHD